MSVQRAKLKVDPDDKAATMYVEYEGPDPKSAVRRVVATGYHHAENLTTGLPAVFTDGETVPDWALTAEDRKKLGLPAAE